MASELPIWRSLVRHIPESVRRTIWSNDRHNHRSHQARSSARKVPLNTQEIPGVQVLLHAAPLITPDGGVPAAGYAITATAAGRKAAITQARQVEFEGVSQ
jgi:hypothetical protein